MRPCKKTIGLHKQYDRTEISIMKLCCRLKMGLVPLLVHRSFGGVTVPPLERIGYRAAQGMGTERCSET